MEAPAAPVQGRPVAPLDYPRIFFQRRDLPMTIDHKAFFAVMAKQNPHCQPTESEMQTMFWENLFQAFKARYDEERAAAVQILPPMAEE